MGIYIESIEPRVLLAASELDSSFGKGGIATLNLSAPVNANNTILLAKTPVGGAIVEVNQQLVMVNPDGSQILNFGHHGQVDIPDFVSAIAVDPVSGEIAVSESTEKAVIQFYTPQGQPDHRGVNGLVKPDFKAAGASAVIHSITHMAFAPDGGLILDGDEPLGLHSDTLLEIPLVIAKLNADGSIDAKFGNHANVSAIGHAHRRPSG